VKTKNLSTNVIIFSKNNLITGFEIKGHANFAEYGYDIVCAGVSSLSIAIINGILEVLDLKPEVVQENGYLFCNLENLKEEELLKAQTLLKTFYLGIKSIETNYSDYIKVTKK